ncbi:MAG TPA: GAF domain-containing protein [Anaerolineae bacterium]|nr:GAF domain-containing protein [Anaerolineae bacterium]HQH37018.1 GAF domain-containing protein [Anaerolineae bacterium]
MKNSLKPAENRNILATKRSAVAGRSDPASGLAEENRRLMSLMDHLPGMAYRYRHNAKRRWTLEFVSGGCAALTGWHPDEWLKDHRDAFMEWVHPEDYQDVIAQIAAALRDRQPYRCVYRLVTADQTQKWVLDQGTGVYAENGDWLFCEGFVTDITAEKQREGIHIYSEEQVEQLQATALAASTLDLQAVLTLIMAQLESLFPYESGSLQIVEQDTMRVIAARNAPDAPPGWCYPLSDYPYHRRLAQGEIVVFEDVQQQTGSTEVLSRRSNLGVPLWVRDRVIGALILSSRRARAYTDEDIRVVRLFAQQAAIAIENARLLEAQRVQRELAEALEAAASVVSSVLDFDQVLDYILDQVTRVVPGDIFNIILIEGEIGRMIRWRGYAEHGISTTPDERARVPILTYPSLVQMIKNGRPIIIADIHQDPQWVQIPGQEKLRAYMAAPIRIAGKTEGFINVSALSVGQFDDQDAKRLQAFADHAAMALQNARLFQQTLHHAEELERRVRERTIELEAKNAWLEAILSGTVDGIVVTDSDGQVVDANQVARMWLYHSLPAQDVERLREMIRDLARRAESHPDAMIELTGLDLELSAASILGQGAEGPAVVVAVHDVSYLKALDRMKSQFVSNVSHELRTPLASIRLYSSLIQRNSQENWQRYFVALDHEVARLSKLVEDILEISRIEAGQLELERHLVDLNMLTEITVMSHKILAESHGLTVTYRAADDKIIVSVDHDKFVQVVNNLVENAINYTLEGGNIAISTERRIKDKRPWGALTVTDTGIGIPQHELDHLFERFFRGSEPQNLHIQGSGLGLAIVKEIVELHGGSVTVESQVGAGSTFTVWLPLIET